MPSSSLRFAIRWNQEKVGICLYHSWLPLRISSGGRFVLTMSEFLRATLQGKLYDEHSKFLLACYDHFLAFNSGRKCSVYHAGINTECRWKDAILMVVSKCLIACGVRNKITEKRKINRNFVRHFLCPFQAPCSPTDFIRRKVSSYEDDSMDTKNPTT